MKTNTTNTAIAITNGAVEHHDNFVRANRIAVQSKGDIIVATFWRTHVRVATLASNETGWMPSEGANKAAQIEEFRRFAIDHAADIGVIYDPAKHMVVNVKPTYETEEDVWHDFDVLNLEAIKTLINNSKYGMEFKGIQHDSLVPLTETPKGTNLADLGVEDGRYVKSGKMAWFAIRAYADMVHKETGTEISVSLGATLVSGQMKKVSTISGMHNVNMVQKNMDEAIMMELTMAGVEIPSKEDTKAAKKAAKESKTEETPKAEEEKTTKKQTTKKRTSKKSAKAEAQTTNA